MKRRTFLKASSALAAATALPRMAFSQTSSGIFELRAQKADVKLAGGKYAASELWLYNGTNPGPEIRVTKGGRVRVKFINELDEPTSIHWHGIRIDNAMDGVSGLTQDPVPPGGSFDYDFVVPDAGTFWYHAHNQSWNQVAHGLYGALIVDEPTIPYDRNHDLTLLIDDWRLDRSGSLDVESLGALRDWSHAGRLGNWVTVNGVSQPQFLLNAGEAYRLRLINAANARVFQISPKAMGARVLAYDGFPLPEPLDYPSDVLLMAPGQRVDLMVTPNSDDSIAMNDIAEFALQELSGQEALSLATFKIARKESALPSAFLPLQPNTIAQPDVSNALEVPLTMSGGAMGQFESITHKGKVQNREDMIASKQVWAFNGTANLADKPMFSVNRGQTVVIKSENQTGWMHGIHLHGHHFQIIARNGTPVEPAPWRDTYITDRDESVDIAFVADNPGKWLLHCHMLEHAAAGMNTWFEVI